MAKIKRTREERIQDRQVARGERKKFRELPKDVKQDIRRSERYDNKRERQGQRLAKQLAKSDIELNKKKASNLMEENPAVGQTLSKFAQGRGFGQANIPTTTNTDLNNATIQTQANTIPTAGITLASAVAKDPNATLTDLQKLPDATKAVNEIQDKETASIANNAISTNTAVADTPKAEVPAVASQVAANEVSDAEQGGIPSMPIKPAQTIDNAGTMPSERIPGDGSMLNQQMQGGGYNFAQDLTKDKVEDEITKGALSGFSNAPTYAIEKLGVQDYFPNAGQNIAVGSYSGKYIGNATIFAAPGARMPLGLYDAHMRALKDAAAEKQKVIDKILTAPQTAAQFQEQFNNSYLFPNLNKYMEKHGNDPYAMMNDPEFMQFMANAEAKARDTKQTAEWAKTLSDSYQKEGVYIPKGMMEDVEKILYATGEDYDAYLRGENTSFGQAMRNAKAYQDMMPDIAELMKTVTAPDRLTERPFNFKTGGKYDDPEFVAGRNKFMQQVMDGTAVQGTDIYASGIIKYFDVADIEQSIKAEFASRNASEEQLPYALEYAAGLIPAESIKFSYETVKTDELDWEKHYQHIKEWNKEQRDEEMSFARTLDGGASDMVHPKTNKTFNQEIAALNKSGLTGTARQKKLEEIYGIYMGSMNGSTVKTDKNGTIVSAVPLPDIKAVQGDPNKRTYTVSFKDPITGKPVSKTMTAAQIAQTPPNFKLSIGGRTIQNNSDYATIMEKPISLEGRKAFYDRNNRLQYLTADNTDEYDKSPLGSRVTLETEKIQTYIVKTGEDATGATYQYYEAIPGQIDGSVYNISNPSGQQLVDDRVGFNTWQAAQVQGGGQTTISSGSTRPQ